MNKPITILRKDFIDTIVNLINNCGLPAFVIEDILKSCINEISLMANNQLKKDLEDYNNSINEEGDE